MPRLTRRRDGEAFELRDGLTVLGRSSNSDIQVNEPPVSRTHCRIEGPTGGWVVTDAGSKLGTFVNGRRVQQHRLEPGDELRVGSDLFAFEEGPPPAAGGAEAPEPPRRRPWLRLVPLAAAGLALVAVGVLAVVVVATRPTPQRVVRRAAELLSRRDADALWRLVAAERKQQITVEEFREQIQLLPDALVESCQRMEVGRGRRAELGVVVPIAVSVGGERVADEVVLFREDGEWKIHTVPYARIQELVSKQRGPQQPD